MQHWCLKGEGGEVQKKKLEKCLTVMNCSVVGAQQQMLCVPLDMAVPTSLSAGLCGLAKCITCNSVSRIHKGLSGCILKGLMMCG